jgi:hypothetical protein
MRISTLVVRKSFSLMLLAASLWLFFNASVNWHYHTLLDGNVVKHSHPFKKADFPAKFPQSHSHSSAEYLLYDQYSHTDSPQIGLPAFLLETPQLSSVAYSVRPQTNIPGKQAGFVQLRAPPIYS